MHGIRLGSGWWVLETPFRLPGRHPCLHPRSFAVVWLVWLCGEGQRSGDQHSWRAGNETLPLGAGRVDPLAELQRQRQRTRKSCCGGGSNGQQQQRASKYPWLAVWSPCRLKTYKPGSREFYAVILVYFSAEAAIIGCPVSARHSRTIAFWRSENHQMANIAKVDW